MSNSTLADYYRGMKMPYYDGKNVFDNIRNLNGANTGFQEVIDPQYIAHSSQQQEIIKERVKVQEVVTSTTTY